MSNCLGSFLMQDMPTGVSIGPFQVADKTPVGMIFFTIEQIPYLYLICLMIRTSYNF